MWCVVVTPPTQSFLDFEKRLYDVPYHHDADAVADAATATAPTEDVTVRPTVPTSDMCCGNGCKNCVYLLYWRDLARFEAYEARMAKQTADANVARAVASAVAANVAHAAAAVPPPMPAVAVADPARGDAEVSATAATATRQRDAVDVGALATPPRSPPVALHESSSGGASPGRATGVS